MAEKTVRVRGVHLVHEGRGYHDVELELPEGVAQHYVNLGKAVPVEVQGKSPAVQPGAPIKSSDMV